MSRAITANFLYVCVNPSSEKLLVQEMHLKYPFLHLSYSRPGFVTFKNSHPTMALTLDFELHSLFAQRYGLCLFLCKPEDGQLKWQRWCEEHGYGQGQGTQEWHQHVWQLFSPTENEDTADKNDLPNTSTDPALLQLEDEVVDFILLRPQEMAVGVHRHKAGITPYPGGFPPIVLPPEAPSRAYLKIAQAQIFTQAHLREGDWVLDLGAAPGGASYYLLQQKCKVMAVDPGEMSAVAVGPHFIHVQQSIQNLQKRNLRDIAFSWICLDINLTPDYVLPELQRVLSLLPHPSLKGMFLTLKINDWRSLSPQIPRFLEKIQGLRQQGDYGKKVKWYRAIQLPGHRQEFLVAAFF